MSVIAKVWLKNQGPGHRTTMQSLKGDQSNLVVENDSTLVTYDINGVCTTLSKWCSAVIKAPLSLVLAQGDLDDMKVVFVPRVETHFRTGEAPWWGLNTRHSIAEAFHLILPVLFIFINGLYFLSFKTK